MLDSSMKTQFVSKLLIFIGQERSELNVKEEEEGNAFPLRRNGSPETRCAYLAHARNVSCVCVHEIKGGHFPVSKLVSLSSARVNYAVR